MKKYLQIKHFSLIGLVLLFIASGVRGVELSSMTVFSLPRENFQAEIEVLDLEGLNEADIKVSLPNRKIFKKLNLKYNTYLDEISLLFIALTNNKGIIKVSSLFPIEEKKIVLLVNLNWPNGTVTREYSVRITESGAANQKTTEIQLPAEYFEKNKVDKTEADKIIVDKIETDKTLAEVTKETDEKEPLVESQPVLATDITNVRIDIVDGDTLRNIAENIKSAFYRYESNVTLEQIMLSILEEQPQAFQSDTKFKTGISISLPQYQDVTKYNSEFAREVINKLELEATKRQLSKAKQNSKKRKASAIPQSKPKERVKLSTSKVNKNKTNKNINAKLAANLEELDKLKRQSSELKFRLQNLQSQLEDSKRLLALKNEQLQEMKMGLEKAKRELAEIKEQRSVFDLYLNTPMFWISLALAFLLLIIVLRIVFGSAQIRRQQRKSAKNKMMMEDYDVASARSYRKPLQTFDDEVGKDTYDYIYNKDESDHKDAAVFTNSAESYAEDDTDQLQDETVDTEMDAKLDLARAYAGMNALAEAEDLIKDVLDQGSEAQIEEANRILAEMQAKKS